VTLVILAGNSIKNVLYTLLTSLHVIFIPLFHKVH